MITLELKITDNSILKNVLKTLSKFKGVQIEEKKEYSEAWKWLITALEELDIYKRWEKTFWNARDLFKNL